MIHQFLASSFFPSSLNHRRNKRDLSRYIWLFFILLLIFLDSFLTLLYRKVVWDSVCGMICRFQTTQYPSYLMKFRFAFLFFWYLCCTEATRSFLGYIFRVHWEFHTQVLHAIDAFQECLSPPCVLYPKKPPGCCNESAYHCKWVLSGCCLGRLCYSRSWASIRTTCFLCCIHTWEARFNCLYSIVEQHTIVDCIDNERVPLMKK